MKPCRNVFSLGQARVSYLHRYAGHKVIEAGSGTRCSLTEFTASGTDVLLLAPPSNITICNMAEVDGVNVTHAATQNEPAVSLKLIGDTIKTALFEFKGYFDTSLSKLKQETEKKQQNTSEKVLKLQQSAELTFRFKGNKSQFLFNADILENLEEVAPLLEEGDVTKAKSTVLEAVKSLKKRNKLIRIADKSDAG